MILCCALKFQKKFHILMTKSLYKFVWTPFVCVFVVSHFQVQWAGDLLKKTISMYMEFQYKHNTLVKPSYLYNENPFTGKMASFYWNGYQISYLTHWGRVTHLCVSKLTSIASNNGLSPGRRQAIIWNNAGILLIGSLGTNFSEILI